MVVPPKSALHRLLRVAEEPGPLVILPHDNPDPDALASAAALRFLVHQAREEKEIVIALGGIVGRAENRAMLRYLNIDLIPIGEIDLTAPGQIALVDTQPGRSNNSLPEQVTPTIVIDHHPAYGTYEGVSFLDLRDEYGATSTILTEYLEETHVDVESKIATALFYGINAETQDLGREATPKDVRRVSSSIRTRTSVACPRSRTLVCRVSTSKSSVTRSKVRYCMTKSSFRCCARCSIPTWLPRSPIFCCA